MRRTTFRSESRCARLQRLDRPDHEATEARESPVTYTGNGGVVRRRFTMSKSEPLEAKIEAQLREWAAELET